MLSMVSNWIELIQPWHQRLRIIPLNKQNLSTPPFLSLFPLPSSLLLQRKKEKENWKRKKEINQLYLWNHSHPQWLISHQLTPFISTFFPLRKRRQKRKKATCFDFLSLTNGIGICSNRYHTPEKINLLKCYFFSFHCHLPSFFKKKKDNNEKKDPIDFQPLTKLMLVHWYQRKVHPFLLLSFSLNVCSSFSLPLLPKKKEKQKRKRKPRERQRK